MKNIILVLLLGLTASPTVAGSSDTIPYYLTNAASVFNIDVGLMYAICTVESRCKPRAINKDDATPGKKALGIREHSLGLFQIKMATARSLGFKGTKKEFMTPEVNSFYAAKLLRHLYDKYHDTIKVISAYNAGHYITGNKPYVHKVLVHFTKYQLDRKL